ncbi:hypothetical protein [Neisseria shayeganii]|uniref:Uncharacterized protein n=1 Tax=Neisseria shayeganii 871 TaxID=1032488 RepID=G4CKX3_9NEIS|nr:hypothetical protein [Neisseria shayeganii]EGY51538.1 hypothetical protein HMPREF9371_2264 [Neisseria shayeganii 871]
MRHYLCLLPLLAATPALADTALRCDAVEQVGEAGSGLSQQLCRYAGSSLQAAYRAYLQHERTASERMSQADQFPASLPARNAHHQVSAHVAYRVEWPNRRQVRVVLTDHGDLPANTVLELRRRGKTVEITRTYEAP